jgi:hypothetical protein
MKAYLFVISCPLGLVRIGVSGNPRRRVANLQIGSPVALVLALQREMSDLESARVIVSGLEGAMLVARSYGDVSRFEAAAERMLAGFAAA